MADVKPHIGECSFENFETRFLGRYLNRLGFQSTNMMLCLLYSLSQVLAYALLCLLRTNRSLDMWGILCRCLVELVFVRWPFILIEISIFILIGFGRVPTESMQPTIVVNDIVVISKWCFLYRRNNIIVLNPPSKFYEIGGFSEVTKIVKRIVGVEGDSIEISNGQLFVNGIHCIETFVHDTMLYHVEPMIVPPNCVFVLGDNRNESFDSSEWGCVDSSSIVGKAIIILNAERFISSMKSRCNNV